MLHTLSVLCGLQQHIAYLSVLEPGLLTFLARGPVASAGSVSALSQNLISDIALQTGKRHTSVLAMGCDERAICTPGRPRAQHASVP